MAGFSVNSVSNSLAASHQVQRTQASLANTLTQLATGSRINSAKDDPAGLIAQELLRSEITASNAAVKNTVLANSMLNVAESGMHQISNLLIEAKGLAVEAANTGAMTPQMIEANQVQLNAILDSIDRFSSMTNWLGKPLLDGSVSSENGGALFQLGPDVVSSQQVTVPIESTRTSRVGSGSNLLMELRSGGAASLATNPALADKILSGAISQIATQRGTIGAEQKYTLDVNINALQDSLVQLTAAKSLISDTDFAVATSNAVRDQILLQAGIQSLGLINQSPNYAASLLG
jgi:flagellin